LGLRPRPRWGLHSAPPDSLAGFKGLTCKGKPERERRVRYERGGTEEERKRGDWAGTGTQPIREPYKKSFLRLWLDPDPLTSPGAEWGSAFEPRWGSTPRPLLGL